MELQAKPCSHKSSIAVLQLRHSSGYESPLGIQHLNNSDFKILIFIPHSQETTYTWIWLDQAFVHLMPVTCKDLMRPPVCSRLEQPGGKACTRLKWTDTPRKSMASCWTQGWRGVIGHVLSVVSKKQKTHSSSKPPLEAFLFSFMGFPSCSFDVTTHKGTPKNVARLHCCFSLIALLLTCCIALGQEAAFDWY